jgi:hypothetical protein
MNRSFIRLAAFASPLIWFANQAAQFALAPVACLWHSNAVLVAVASVALVLVALSGLTAWIALDEPVADGTGLASPMPRWLALGGITLSVSFFIVIVAQMIPNLLLAGCA